MPTPLIVAGADGSTGGEHALRWAVRRAEASGGSVRAVRAWEYPALTVFPSPLGITLPPAHQMDETTAESLAADVAPVRAGAEVPIEEVVRRGEAAPVLLQAGADADLLVVGTRGRGRVASVVLGSVSRKVAGSAPCPVAVVPATASLDLDGPVVVGVDGSAGSLAALRWAGRATDGPIRAVHVFEYPFGPEYAVGDFEWSDPIELGHRLVEQAVAETLGDRPDVTLTARRGDAREVLAEAGRDAAMVVVGARGATGLEGFLGSVTTGVASSAPVPVVVVPPDERDDRAGTSRDGAGGP